jgi:hypothetical protein
MVSIQIVKATNCETQIAKILILCEPINGFELAASVDSKSTFSNLKSTLEREIRGQIRLLLTNFTSEVRVFEVGIFVVNGSVTGCIVGVGPRWLCCRLRPRSRPRPRPSKTNLCSLRELAQCLENQWLASFY